MKVTWEDMQSLFACLCLAFQILKVQLCKPINHRVDTNKLQHRLFGVRSCIRNSCSITNGMRRHPDAQSHIDSCFQRARKWLYKKNLERWQPTFVQSDLNWISLPTF